MKKYTKIVFDGKFFNIFDTLSCGQFFRYIRHEEGFLVFSLDKCAYCYSVSDQTVIECEENDKAYFENFFDLSTDYKGIYEFARGCDYEFVSHCAKLGCGIRILKQDKLENLISFIISQNNNIPRIKGIIEKLCLLGEEKTFKDIRYNAFPSLESLRNKDLEYYYSIGLGYRAKFIKNLVDTPNLEEKLASFSRLDTKALKNELLKIYGVGEKVADCVLFFGFSRTDSFPVDTWIEKVYKENFSGNLKDRKQISNWFVEIFKNYSGYIQQYLFHYKRNVEKNEMQ